MISDPGFCKPILFRDFLITALAEATISKTLQVFDPKSLKTVQYVELENRDKLGVPLDLTACDQRIYCGFESGDIFIFGSNFSVETRLDTFQSTDPLLSLATAGDHIYAVNTAGTLIKCDRNNERKKSIVLNDKVSQCSIRQDGKVLCVGTVGGKVTLLSAKSLKMLSGLWLALSWNCITDRCGCKKPQTLTYKELQKMILGWLSLRCKELRKFLYLIFR